MLYSYQLKQGLVLDEEMMSHTSWGVSASSNGVEVLCVPDIFLDRERAERFVEKCNKSKLSLIHLMDVIEDALAE
jgi:hypothetical protein